MSALQRAAQLAHWRSAAMARRVEEASRIISDAARTAGGRVYVTFSGGKDSSVLLHLAHQLLGPIEARIILWPESDVISNFGQVLDGWRQRWPGVTIREVHLFRDSVGDAVADRWDALHDDGGAYLIGLRADESRARMMTLKAHGVIHRMASGLLRVAPLAWWRTADVAAYTTAHDLPLLDNYVQGGFGERTSTRVPREQVRDQFLFELRTRDPQGYNQLVLMYPDLCGR